MMPSFILPETDKFPFAAQLRAGRFIIDFETKKVVEESELTALKQREPASTDQMYERAVKNDRRPVGNQYMLHLTDIDRKFVIQYLR